VRGDRRVAGEREQASRAVARAGPGGPAARRPLHPLSDRRPHARAPLSPGLWLARRAPRDDARPPGLARAGCAGEAGAPQMGHARRPGATGAGRSWITRRGFGRTRPRGTGLAFARPGRRGRSSVRPREDRSMGYQFTRAWARGSVVIGVGVFVIAVLLAAWLGFSNDYEFERFSAAVRIVAFLIVSLAGLLLGGTMIVAGQLVSVLLDQRDLLSKIHEALATGRTALSGGR